VLAFIVILAAGIAQLERAARCERAAVDASADIGNVKLLAAIFA
jgi:hypothetical protein